MKSRFGSLVSVLAATLSASCCVLPVVLLVLGSTSLGPFAVLMRYRPITLTFSLPDIRNQKPGFSFAPAFLTFQNAQKALIRLV